VKGKALVNYDGEARLYSAFLNNESSQYYFNMLASSLSWQEELIKMFGKTVKVPRLIAWYGDDGVTYSYSGINHEAMPWTTELLELKKLVSKHAGADFNSVLANLYRNQHDYMGWHCDNEKSLGQNPLIVSLSLGQSRDFKFRHKLKKEVVNCKLNSGDLLLMGGSLQACWKHCLPKRKGILGPRINLTFRTVIRN